MLPSLHKLSLLAAALACATPAMALEAWHGQEGSSSMEVLFNGQVWKNAWWVGSGQCPANVAKDGEAMNAWRLLRSATPDEMKRYGNPTSCQTSGGGSGAGGSSAFPAFDGYQAYRKGDKVTVSGGDYIASTDVPVNSFRPGQASPWKPYTPLQPWQAGVTYKGGDRVLKDGYGYEALFWTQNADPANPANQNPQQNNGRPWKPLGQMRNYTAAELAQAPQWSAGLLYPAGALVRYNSSYFVAQQAVKSVYPGQLNPWKSYVNWGNTKTLVGQAKSAWPRQVFAPYVDATAWPMVNMADLALQKGVKHFTLAFVVAKDAKTCAPTWGASYKMGDYTALYNNIRALRDAGGDVMVSIGGANNAPLSAACANVDELAQMYLDLVDNLNLKALDFDIEGTWVADPASIARRSQALAKAQRVWSSQGKAVKIWFTLPTLPTGLTQEGIKVLQSARQNGVALSGVNVMTMDYGDNACAPSGPAGQNTQGQCGVSAVNALFAQVKSVFPDKSDAAVWSMLGTTPMIGVNDVQTEKYYLSDAELTLSHARQHGLGMIGMWSVGRDKPGPAGQVAPDHSGLPSSQAQPYAFSQLFSGFTKP